MSRSIAIWVAVLLVFAGGMALWTGYKLSHGRPAFGFGPADPNEPLVLDSKPLEKFTLIDGGGKTFESKSLDGKIWIASFFYASCPGFCRKQNEFIGELAKEYGPKGVHFVSITVDPARDTPSVLSSYADRLLADREKWHFLTGKEDYILKVGRDIFKVSVQPETHSDRLILVGPDGKVLDQFHSTNFDEMAELREHLDHLLKQPAAGEAKPQQPAPATTAEPAPAASTEGK